MKVLADAVGVTPGTATSMAKHIAAQGLIEYRPRRGTLLTEDGRRIATDIVRRHRLIETFLERIMGYDWGEVHTEAEELEHVVSSRFVDRIDAMLGFPEHDPHGDPIPRPDGRIGGEDHDSLAGVAAGTSVRIVRITENDTDLLAFLKRHGLVPGTTVAITANDPVSGTMEVTHERNAVSIGLPVAAHVLVEGAATPENGSG